MPILLDTRMVPSVDATFEFLADVALHAGNMGHEVVFHPGVRESPLRAVNLARLPYSEGEPSNLGQEVDAHTMEVLTSAYALWDEPHTREDVRAALDREVSLLRDNRITGVIVWGSAHPLSLTLQRAAQREGIPSLVMERGLIPDSWTLFEQAQWVHSPARAHGFAHAPVEALLEDARQRLLTPFGGKYSEPLDDEAELSSSTPQVLFATGFPRALGHSDEQDGGEADVIWNRVVANGSRHGFTPTWRGHPAAAYTPSPAPTAGQLAASIPQALAHSSALICQGTNTWAYGVLWNVPTLVVAMPSAREAQILATDLPDGDGASLIVDAARRWSAGLRDELYRILEEELGSTHFYWLSPGYDVPGAREFIRHALAMMGLAPGEGPTEPSSLVDVYRERIRELLREARIVASQHRAHEEAFAVVTWELEHTTQRLIRIEGELARSIVEKDEAQAALDAVTRSQFWRASRPIRELLARLKR
jgi:GNAT superfamily N-acetyltransferase